MEKRPMHRILYALLIVPLAFALGACRTPQGPEQVVSQAESAVERASLGEAPQYAPLELRLAREKLTEARDKLANEEYDDARRLAEKAIVDARLAEVKAEAATARATADDLQQGVETIRSEAERVPATAPTTETTR
jgi:hypothetical protein